MNLVSKISRFNNKRHVLIYNQGVGDIMQGLLKTHSLHTSDYDKICIYFDSSNELNICRKIYNYLVKNTHYKIESDDEQTLRSPAAILELGSNRNIGLDCKNYALFIGGILDALNRRGKKINWCYRFASYRTFNKVPHHVFVVVNPDTKNEIWCDPVIKTFNYKKPYSYKIDKKIMALVQISGIGKTKKSKSERRNIIKNKIKNRIKKGGKLLLKLNPATISARNSFLLLLKLNFLNLAVNLFQIIQKGKENDLKKFWSHLGGDYDKLKGSIKEGLNHHNKHHREKINYSSLGVLPAIAGAIAAATPIILKIKALLKAAGVDTTKIEDVAKQVLKKVVDNKMEAFAEAQINKEDSGEATGEDFSSEENQDSVSEENSNNESSNEESSMSGFQYITN